MTGYADLTHRVIKRIRELNPSTYMIWGGIHPIIQPEDAILADVDAICTGEGEFAFEELLQRLKEGRDYTHDEELLVQARSQRQRQRPGDHQEPLPAADDRARRWRRCRSRSTARETEKIYLPGQGFVKMGVEDYLLNDGLGYTTLWSIGCPFHCAYCGNTKFIANDTKYKRIRHPSARYMVDQVKDARARFPHLSQVSFHDDSFMAIPYGQLEEFAELWHDELKLPVRRLRRDPQLRAPGQVRAALLGGDEPHPHGHPVGLEGRCSTSTSARRRRRRSSRAGKVIASFAPKYHIPAAYDIIMDNPIETRDDVKSTLQLLYMMDRPYTLFIYSLKVIPNTGLATAMEERGVDLDEIDDTLPRDPAAVGEPHALPHRPVAPAAVAVEPADGPRAREPRAAEALPAPRRSSCARCT